jgi:hypothetical protein
VGVGGRGVCVRETGSYLRLGSMSAGRRDYYYYYQF